MSDDTNANKVDATEDRVPLEFTGYLEGFWETGTEGVLWSLEEEPFKGYEGLHVLKNGDFLRVFKEDGAIVWEGTIDLEYETGFRSYPLNPQYGQQEVFGMWVHGNQRGMKIEDWAEMFFAGQLRENNRYSGRLRATLRPAPEEKTAGDAS